MNRVLEYAARRRQRGTAYGTASMVMAGLVLAAPLGMMLVNTELQRLMRQPLGLGLGASFEVTNWVIDWPMAATVGFPVAGLLLGAVGLSLRCKRDWMVVLGVLVNIAGLIAAVGVIYWKG